jgi:hypothetical protein
MLAADIQYDTLARSLLIALVIVSPYGIYKVREVRAMRREREAASRPVEVAPSGPVRPDLETIIEQISGFAGRADSAPPTITVPHDVTVGGGDPPPGLVDALVRDALRRSGLVATAELDTPDGRMIELRPAGATAEP